MTGLQNFSSLFNFLGKFWKFREMDCFELPSYKKWTLDVFISSSRIGPGVRMFVRSTPSFQSPKPTMIVSALSVMNLKKLGFFGIILNYFCSQGAEA